MASVQGLPVSPGLAVGRAVIIRFSGFPAFRRAIEPSQFESEERRLRRGARRASEDFLHHSTNASDTDGTMGSELAAILEAHGWRVLRIDYQQVRRRPEQTLARIRAALATP